VHFGLPPLRKRLGADLVVANAENAADGLGLDAAIYADLRASGVDVVTSGNHIWQRREIQGLLDAEERLLRPENYPAGVPGHGVAVVRVGDTAVGVVNLEGRRFLSSLRCPLTTGRRLAAGLRSKAAVLVVDFHAEASDEKEAFAFHLDGVVSAIFGTHTHVQTADERVLPGGTGYITDVGMCGASGGVIGMKPEVSVRRFVTQMPLKMEVEDGPSALCGALAEIDPATGRCLAMSRVRE